MCRQGGTHGPIPAATDRRTSVGRALAAWRADLAADLGGPDALGTQQKALVDMVVTQRLLLQSIDAWLLSQKQLVNLRNRALLPAVKERQAIADGLARVLDRLGLERRTKQLDVAEVLAQLHAPDPTPAPSAPTPEPDGRP